MRRLLFVLTVFILIILLANFGLMVLIHERSSQSYFASILDKEARLASIPSPRVILVGGSGVAFGMNSDQIEAALGMPVVNMGLQGCLGLRFMLDEVRSEIRSGDVIVIIPEYMHFFLDGNGSATLVQALFTVPQSLATLSTPGQYINVIRNFLPVYTDAVLHMAEDWINFGCFECPDQVDRTYARTVFNIYGDIRRGVAIGRRGIADNPLWNPSLPDPQINPLTRDVVQMLNTFNQQAVSRGATVYLSFPIARSINFQGSESRIQGLYQFLQNELHIPMINMPEDNVLPVQYFFDTAYHVNDQGRDLRTSMLISDLEEALAHP